MSYSVISKLTLARYLLLMMKVRTCNTIVSQGSCQRNSEFHSVTFSEVRNIDLPRDDIDQVMRNVTIATASRNLPG